MSLDSILSFIIVPAIFIWIGAKIYSHEKEQIDPLVHKIKGWFQEKGKEESFDSTKEYNINYIGAEY